MMKKWMGIVIIFVGIGLIAYPFYMEYEQNKEVR